MRAAPPYNKTAVICNTIRVVVVVVVGGGKKWSERERDVRCRGNDRGVIFYGRPHARRLEFCSVAFGLSCWKGLGRRLYVCHSEARIEYGILWRRNELDDTLARSASQFFRPCFAFVFVWAHTKEKKERDEARASASVSCSSILT